VQNLEEYAVGAIHRKSKIHAYFKSPNMVDYFRRKDEKYGINIIIVQNFQKKKLDLPLSVLDLVMVNAYYLLIS
jgi:hypothetical protein